MKNDKKKCWECKYAFQAYDENWYCEKDKEFPDAYDIMNEDAPACDSFKERERSIDRENIKELAVDIGYLYDWYQNSVMDDPPYWTDEHIKEMFHDFYLIPKQEDEIDD